MWRIAGWGEENLHAFGDQQEVVCMNSKEDSQERKTQQGKAMYFPPRRWKAEVFPWDHLCTIFINSPTRARCGVGSFSF